MMTPEKAEPTGVSGRSQKFGSAAGLARISAPIVCDRARPVKLVEVRDGR